MRMGGLDTHDLRCPACRQRLDSEKRVTQLEADIAGLRRELEAEEDVHRDQKVGLIDAIGNYVNAARRER